MLIKILTRKMRLNFSLYFCSGIGLDVAAGTSKVSCLIFGSMPVLCQRFPIRDLSNLW